MISLFAKSSDSARLRQDPRTGLTISAIWILLSIVWLGLSRARIEHIKAHGQPVSGLRYGAPVFWASILLFWLWMAWKNFRRLSVESL